MKSIKTALAIAALLMISACNQAGTKPADAELESLRVQNEQLLQENEALREKVSQLDSALQAQQANLKDVEDDLEDVIGFLTGMGY